MAAIALEHVQKTFSGSARPAVADLSAIPFTQKTDLLPTEAEPQRFLQFILQPDQEKLLRELAEMERRTFRRIASRFSKRSRTTLPGRNPSEAALTGSGIFGDKSLCKHAKLHSPKIPDPLVRHAVCG